MGEINARFAQHNYDCCWFSDRYYDKTDWQCIDVQKNGIITINFPDGQPGLVLQKWGFVILQEVAAGQFRELTFDILGQYLVSLRVSGAPIEGYSGLSFPITSYLSPAASIPLNSCTIFNPAWLVDIAILINQPATRIQVDMINTSGLLPNGLCFMARIMGKYLQK